MPKHKTFAQETLTIARERVTGIKVAILGEVERLLNSGAVDPDSHSRGLLLGVAIENIADKWLAGGERRKREYKNLKCF